MHCLPVRRGVVVADAVLDGPRSVVVQEARNRMLVQMAVLPSEMLTRLETRNDLDDNGPDHARHRPIRR